MSNRPILTPTAEHPITIEQAPDRVIVRLGERVIADTRNALTLREANYPPVQYIPRADVDMTQLRRADHGSYCPYKGDAGYFDLPALGDEGANAVWTYEQPFEAVAAIGGHVAFYPRGVEISRHPA